MWIARTQKLFPFISILLAVIGYACASHPPLATDHTIRPARVEGTRLIVTRQDGTEVSDKALVGSVIVGLGPDNQLNSFRIDAVEPYSDSLVGNIFLYQFSVKDSVQGTWHPLCVADPQGRVGGFPISGSWSPAGEHLKTENFSIPCTSGVIGKCVMFGYKPWETMPDGHSMWDYHQACTRMLRADYCGDGIGHTRNGTPIDVMDRFLFPKDDNKKLVFEAAWAPDGATCIAKTRLQTPWTLESISAECPKKFRDRLGDTKACSYENSRKDVRALLFNKS